MKCLLLPLIVFTSISVLQAEEIAISSDIQSSDVVWTLIAAFLVFFMQAGFAMVEIGFTRAKNAGNIIMKNLMDFSVGSISFFILGFGLMFGDSISGFLGSSKFILSNASPSNPDGLWVFAFWLFQAPYPFSLRIAPRAGRRHPIRKDAAR